MKFLQKLLTFFSSVRTFLLRFCPESNQPRSEQEQRPATSSIHIEMPQLQTLTSPSSTSPSNDHESSEPPSPSPASGALTPPTPPNLNRQLEPVLAAQQHLQWQNAVVAFCFSYALSASLQTLGTDQSNHEQLPLRLILLSFLVLLTFTFILVAFFIHRSCKRTSKALEKVAFLLAAAAFCRALSIPLPFELQCAVWAVFLTTLLIIVIFTCLNPVPT